MSSLVTYIQFINKMIALCSPIAPLIALFLKKAGLFKQPVNPRNELIEFVAIPAFGFFGGAMGLIITLSGALVLLVVIGIQIYHVQAASAWSEPGSGIQLPSLNLDTSALISAGVSIVSTLIIFGSHNKLRGIAFLAGCCLGAAIGIMVVASWVLH